MRVVTPPAGSRCLHCDYLLHGLDAARCPECGGTFNPQDLKTVREPGTTGTRRVVVRRAGTAMSSTPLMTLWLLLSTWGAAVIGILILPIAVVLFMWAAACRRWLAIVLALLLSPMFVSFASGVAMYAGGGAVIQGMGLPGTEYYNVDPQLRCDRASGGCLVNDTEWMTQLPNNGAIALMTRVFGPQAGAYTGPYPSAAQASAAVLAGGEPVPAAAVRADSIALKAGTVKLAAGVGNRLLGNTYLGGWYDPAFPPAFAAQTLHEIGPITGTTWQGCLILRIPAGELKSANGEAQAACIVVIDSVTGYPFAYYAEGAYHHRFPPVRWRN